MLGLGNSLTAPFIGFSNTHSVEFDGSNDHVTMGTVHNLSDADFSVSVWFKRASLTSADGLIMKRQDTDNVWFLQVTSAEKIFFQASTSRTVRIKYLTEAQTTLNNTDWHHIVVTVDRSDASVSRIWLDGVAITSYDTETETGITEDIDNTGDLIIGQGAASGGSYFHGNIADISIWNTAFVPTGLLTIGDLRDGESGAGNAVPADIKGYSGLVSWYGMGDLYFDDGNVAGNGLITDKVDDTIGSELVASNVAAEWTDNSDNSTITNITGGVSIADDYNFSDIGHLRDGSSTTGLLSTNLTVGDIYKVTFDAYHNGTGTPQVRVRDGASNFDVSITDTNATYTVYIKSAHASDGSIRTSNNSTGSIVYLTNLSIKKVNGKPGIMTNMAPEDMVLGSVTQY
tara:strand:- start:502 stop:1701 length:1200 start_codon:yes stop_codon:yes gene_type:complete